MKPKLCIENIAVYNCSSDLLLKLQAQIHKELRSRKVLRSENSITCDLADYLFQEALELKLMNKSNKGFTALDPMTNERFKIKGRRPVLGNKSNQLSNIRDLSSGTFDKLAAVIFDEEYNVEIAAIVPANIVVNGSIPNVRTNSAFFRLEPEVFEMKQVENVTAKLQEAREKLIL